MTRKTPLTLEEHRVLAAELAAMQRRLTYLACHLPNRLGQTSRVGRYANRLGHVLDNVRSALDDDLARDFPNEFSPRVYYPTGEPDSTAQWNSNPQ